MTAETEQRLRKPTPRAHSPSVTSLSGFMCFVLILVFTLSLVSDVSPFSGKVLYVNTTHTQFQVQSYFLLDVVVRLCPVIVNSNCIPNFCIFHIAKTGLLRCCQKHPTECRQHKRSIFRTRLRGPTCNVGGMSACKCDVHYLVNSPST